MTVKELIDDSTNDQLKYKTFTKKELADLETDFESYQKENENILKRNFEEMRSLLVQAQNKGVEVYDNVKKFVVQAYYFKFSAYYFDLSESVAHLMTTDSVIVFLMDNVIIIILWYK